MNIFFIIIITILLTSGCGFRNEYIESKAKLAIGKNIDYSIVDYPDLTLHFRLYNDIRLLKRTTAVVVPVEYNNNVIKHIAFASSKGSNYDFNNEFRILLAILPKESGFKIDIKKLILSIDDISYFASMLEGPINYFPYFNFAFPKNLSEEYQKKYTKEGDIFSMLQKDEKAASLGEKILLNKIDLWNCYEIVFSVPTPSPTQNIKLDILGLYKNNKLYSIAPIEFEANKFTDIGSVP